MITITDAHYNSKPAKGSDISFELNGKMLAYEDI